MSSNYTAVPGNVSLAAPVTATVPADGDVDNAATFTVGTQKLADYIAALAQAVPVATFAEGFESATFPPNSPPGSWAAPSPRFGSDSSWVRTLTNPIAGTASASTPLPMNPSTNSSIGLTITFASPSRVSFLFAINCNQNNGDHLDFYVDSVLTAQFSTRVSNTLIGGKFITDILREGPHTFDWRYVRGGSASVGSEECKIDTVEILPEIIWTADPTRIGAFSEGWLYGPVGTIGASNAQQGMWSVLTGANAGSVNTPSVTGVQGVGGLQLACAATAAADFANTTMQVWGNPGSTNLFKPATLGSYFETRALLVGTASVNAQYKVGWVADGGGSHDYLWLYDGSLGASSTLRWRSNINGTITVADSGIASTAGWFRLGVIAATVRGTFTATFVKDGKALPGAASIPPLLPITDPGGFTVDMKPTVQVNSVTAASAQQIVVGWGRMLSARP